MTVWHTPTEAARLLRCTPREVRNLCADRRIDHRRTGTPARVRYLISDDAINKYIRAQIVRAS